MQSRISQLMGIDYKFDLMLSEDGSGRGAALVAATLKSEYREQKTQKKLLLFVSFITAVACEQTLVNDNNVFR